MEFSIPGYLLENYHSGPKKIIELVQKEGGLSKSEITAEFVNDEWLVTVAPIPSAPGEHELIVIVESHQFSSPLLF